VAARNAVLGAGFCRELIERARDAGRARALTKSMLAEVLNEHARGAPEFRNDVLSGIKAREQVTAGLAWLRGEAKAIFMSSDSAADREAADVAVAELRKAMSNLMADATAEMPPLL
jgi:hypothetical protein